MFCRSISRRSSGAMAAGSCSRLLPVRVCFIVVVIVVGRVRRNERTGQSSVEHTHKLAHRTGTNRRQPADA